MPSPIRVAAVGLGWVTLARHIPALRHCADIRLMGVIGRQPGKAAETARRYGLTHHADTYDLERIAWLKDIDALTIGATPIHHAALTQKALAMGKHVLVEKPFAMTVAEGEAMVASAKTNNRVLAAVHNFQFCRAVGKLSQDIQNGELGRIARITATHVRNPRRRAKEWIDGLPLGFFYDESPHFFYLLRRLAGGELKLQHAHGVASQDSSGKTPSQVSLLYRGAANVPVTIDCRYDSALSEWHVMVTGEKATGIADLYRDIYIRLPNDGEHGALNALRTSACAIAQHLYQHIPNGFAQICGKLDYGNFEVANRFARAINGDSQALTGMSGDDALAVLRLQHEAIEALRHHWYS